MPSWPEATQESSELRGIELVLRKFEQCEFRAEDFHHRDHLAVMVCYLEQMPLRQALAHIREALLRFTAHHNRKGYNETITRFWIAKVAQMLAILPGGLPLETLADRVCEALGNKELLFDYYTRELVMSEQAKKVWHEPDLKPL